MTRRRGRQFVQRLPGLGRPVQVLLDQLQATDPRPGMLAVEILVHPRQGLVGVAHTAGDELGGLTGGDVGATAAEQRGGHLEAQRLAAFLHQALGQRQHCQPHRQHQLGRAQHAFLAEADHHRPFRTGRLQRILAIGTGVGEDLMGAGLIGILAEAEGAGHGAADQAIHGVLGAAQAGGRVVAQQQRGAHEGEIAVHHANGQPGLGAGVIGRRPFEIEQAQAVGLHRRRGRQPFARRPAAFDDRRRKLAQCRHQRDAGQFSGRAVLEQLEVALEGIAVIGQGAVLAVDLPGRNARQHRAVAGDPAVAGLPCIEVDQSLAAHLVAVRGEFRLAEHQQQAAGIARQDLVPLLVEALAQRLGLVQHRLPGHAPAVRVELTLVLVPEVVVLDRRQIALREFLPAGFDAERVLAVAEPGLQLDEARELGHQLPRRVILEGRAEGHQRIAEAVVAGEGLHRRPRAAVGRAQHQQASAGLRHHALPHRRALQLHRAADQPAHRMGDDTHRLAGGAACIEGGIDRGTEAIGLPLDRLAPVVGELDHLVAAGEELDQIVVDAADRAVGGEAPGRLVRRVFELLEPTEQAEAEPDALAVARDMAAEDARQHEHRGPLGLAAAIAGRIAAGGPLAGRRFARIRQWPDRPPAGLGRDGQRVDDRLGGLLVGEVAEVADLAALVEAEAGALAARRAAIHRAGLHHQVVIGPEEGIGHQRLQPAADRLALHVAGDHP